MDKEELEKEAEELYEDWYAHKLGAISIIGVICKMAEPREKRIAELEAENERLTVSYETLKLHDEEEIGMLKSENAELKEKLKPENCLKLLAKEGYIKFTSDQLTKAKELLKQWLQTSKASGCDNINIVTDTEQFLKEVEK